jgi:REP element-mobilizing transposase RayT
VTAPRRILPGTVYLITRRCSERRFFLRPSAETNELLLYLLALGARRHDIRLHSFCFLSNHYHLVLSDPNALLPAFMRYLNSLVARALNASIGHFESLWAKDGSYSAVEPLEPGDIVAKAAYTLANPVAAGLVRTGAEWPGLRTSPEQLGSTKLVARKPKGFFDPKGHLPDTVELELTTPPGFASAAEFRSLVTAAVVELEQEHREEVAAEGRRFVGVARVLAQNPFARPASSEPRFGLKPRVAARDKWKRIERLVQLGSFASSYRKAFAAWRSGARDVLFPAGTYLMRVLYGVQCAGAA